jgi:molecular chaperone DnaJ
LRGHGGSGLDGSRAGDLYVSVSVTSDEVFERQGEHLFQSVVVPWTELTLGTEVEVPLIDGDIAVLTIPQGTQPGTRFRMKGEGAGKLNGRGRGDLYIDTSTEVPDSLSKDEEALLREFAEMRNENPKKPGRGKRRR